MRGKPSGSVLPESTQERIVNWLKKRNIMKQKFGLQHRRGNKKITAKGNWSLVYW
jgi:hypothetical protein